MEQKIRNIMIAFVSLVSERYVAEPITYPDIAGKPYTAIQTNEAAIVAVQRLFPERPLSDLFLIVSKEVQEKPAPVLAGEKPCTHQEFLERRLLKEYPALAGHFHYFSYTDSVDNMDRNLLDVAEIAKGILNYSHQYPGEKIIIHADMTGGMRHVSMMMLSIMQMLKYSGIVIGEVLYSDPRQKRVYKATQIQRMFTLINGADEFVKFGSVNAIREYFHNKEVSPQLKHLLDCMERFSQAIHLCQTNIMQPVLEQLRMAIDDFQNYGQKDLQEHLFNGLLDTIRREYGKLLTPEGSMLDIIRWCLENEFWQQALTLCTEWLPVYLVDHQIAYTDSPLMQEWCAEEGKSLSRSWKQDFIITCSKTHLSVAAKSNTNHVPKKEISLKNMRKILQDLANHTYTVEWVLRGEAKDYPQLCLFLDDYRRGQEAYNYCRTHPTAFGSFCQNYVHFAEMLRILYQIKKKTGTYHKSFYGCIAKMPYQKLMKQIAVLPKDILQRFMPEIIQTDTDANTYLLDTTPLVLSQAQGNSKWEKRQQMEKFFCKNLLIMSRHRAWNAAGRRR